MTSKTYKNQPIFVLNTKHFAPPTVNTLCEPHRVCNNTHSLQTTHSSSSPSGYLPKHVKQNAYNNNSIPTSSPKYSSDCGCVCTTPTTISQNKQCRHNYHVSRGCTYTNPTDNTKPNRTEPHMHGPLTQCTVRCARCINRCKTPLSHTGRRFEMRL